jgi:hypothetical protein
MGSLKDNGSNHLVLKVLSEAYGGPLQANIPTGPSVADVAAADDTAPNLVRLCSLVSATSGTSAAHMDCMASHGSTWIDGGAAFGEDNV